MVVSEHTAPAVSGRTRSLFGLARRVIAPLLVTTAFVLGAAPAAAGAATFGASAAPLTALFARTSYAPGATAQLRISSNARRLSLQPLSALPKPRGGGRSVFHDIPMAASRSIRWRPGTHSVAVSIGHWPSGVYFFRVGGPHGEVVAPVVVRPRRRGAARVAVVVPTLTWQAYNRRNGDTWYVCPCVRTVDLSRPFEDSGVPYNFVHYDREFYEWLAREHKQVDFLSDEDLDRIASGRELHRLYRLVIFEGHGEYVTSHMYDVTAGYRDLGGRLMFLSANDFFRDVVVRGRSMTLIGEWRSLGRPEAALIGAQYIDWFRNRYPNQQYVVVGARRLRWLFRHTGLRNGRRMKGHFGIEIDGLAPSSPRGTTVAAEIRGIFPHETAQMTYYTTRAGAEVFDAGTIDFGGSADIPQISQIIANLWSHMAARTR